MLAKIGPGREHHLPAAGRRVFLHEVGAGDVGRHQVGRELDARELQVEHARHRVNEQRLGQPGRADDQAVAADEQRHQHLLDDLVLPDDDLLQLGDDLPAARIHPVGERDIVGRLEINRVSHHRVHHPLVRLNSRFPIPNSQVQCWELELELGVHLPSAARISRVFSAIAVTSFSSSDVYFAGPCSPSAAAALRRGARDRAAPGSSARSFGSVGSPSSPAHAERDDRRDLAVLVLRVGTGRRRILAAFLVAVVVEQRVLGGQQPFALVGARHFGLRVT